MTRGTGKPIVVTVTQPRQSPQRRGFRRHLPLGGAAKEQLRMSCNADGGK
jgi:hypothetical protein